MAGIILHEVGHLVLRWRGILRSPPDTVIEAGYLVEQLLFLGVLRAKLEKGVFGENAPWTSQMAVSAILLNRRNRDGDSDYVGSFCILCT
jgi:hypothetical protein